MLGIFLRIIGTITASPNSYLSLACANSILIQYSEFKKELADLTADSLEPFRKKRKELLEREVYVTETLNKGARKAKTIAELTMETVRRKMGLV